MRNLFHPLSPEQRGDLQTAMQAIEAATRLSAAHAKELPYAVRDLSRLLTRERSRMDQPYWISPRLLAAYCRYFLPWNLLRMAHMLPALRLSMAPGDLILDLGSGPLTLPLALWLAYPQWRTLPLTVVCVDVAPNPMQVGRTIFYELAGKDSPWRIETRRGPLDGALRGLRGKAALVTAGNVLNEMSASRDMTLEERMAELVDLIASRLAPGGVFLTVEPGNRLGGKLISLVRQGGIEAGLSVEAPCTHQGPCPMLEPPHGKRATGWCHFSYSLGKAEENAPESLLDLTYKAKLEKQDFSLSCLLLRDADPEAQQKESKRFFARILSDPIRLPGETAPARYACSDLGLLLVLNALRVPSGAALELKRPETTRRDPKTGALMVNPQSPR